MKSHILKEKDPFLNTDSDALDGKSIQGKYTNKGESNNGIAFTIVSDKKERKKS